jgi:aspartate kinase
MKIKVFKFGGASLRTADAIKNASRIVELFSKEKLLIVASAMGKTTNALEKILSLARDGKPFDAEWQHLRATHVNIMKDLFPAGDPVFAAVDEQLEAIKKGAHQEGDYDMVYDQLV